MMEKTNVQNWAYNDTVGGNAKHGKCFGKLIKQSDIVILYLRLLSDENHSTTDYIDYTIDNGVPINFRPVETIYHTVGNINNNRNATVCIDTNGRITARLDTSTNGKINIYTTIIYSTQ